VQQKRRQLEILRIEARLLELQGRLAENARMRDQLIRQRVDAILEDPDKWLIPLRPSTAGEDELQQPAAVHDDEP
jgi:hypothetical protein